MKTSSKLLFALCFVFIGAALISMFPTKAAQNPLATPSYFTIPSAVLHTNCPAPATGQTAYCFAGDGLWISVNGTAYAQLGTSGVSSVAVNGGTPQTGAVVLTIPTQASTTVTSTAVTTIK